MTAPPEVLRRRSTKFWALLGAAALVTVIAAANGHLVYVALVSQPACVPHAKAPVIDSRGSGGVFRAARPSC